MRKIKFEKITKRLAISSAILLSLTITCFSCDKEEDTTPFLGNYSLIEKQMMSNLVEKYDAKIIFDEAHYGEKMSLNELKELLQNLYDLHSEFTIPCSVSYTTSNKATIPQTRVVSTTENHTISTFTVGIGEGESLKASGTASVSYNSFDHKIYTLNGHVTLQVLQSNSSKGYNYFISNNGDEDITPKNPTSETLSNISSVTIRTSVTISASATKYGATVCLVKQCSVSAPTKQGSDATCSIQ